MYQEKINSSHINHVDFISKAIKFSNVIYKEGTQLQIESILKTLESIVAEIKINNKNSKILAFPVSKQK